MRVGAQGAWMVAPAGMVTPAWMVLAAWVVLAVPDACAHAQAGPIGSVAAADATVTGSGGAAMVPAGTRLDLPNGSTVTAAKDHTAPVLLARGGEIRVCQTTRLQLSQAPDQALLLGLDRGALEIRTNVTAADVLVTPDLRFTMSEAGPLELDLRVLPSGDTCVDNRGHRAPTLSISDVFGEATYQVKPGQHVMFEHGSLREVVDRETVPCGCPPDARGVSVADAMIAGGAGGRPTNAQQKTAGEQPFPAAVSEGLAEPSPLPPLAAGQTHVQVASTLAYNPEQPTPAANTNQATAVLPAAPATPSRSGGGPFAAIGRFFKRLFVR